MLEGLSSGIPVLTNNIGIEGISAQSGKEYIHCEKAEDYIRAISDILDGKIDTGQMGLKAKDFIRNNFDYENNTRRFIELIQRI